MAKYVYPAIFVREENGYYIRFPDIRGCVTSAQTLAEGLEMANDALCLTLYSMEEDGLSIPAASDIKDVQTEEGAFVTLVNCDTIEYRKFYDNRAIKKTLTIPAWLNTMAERQDINFSLTLQNALKQALNVQ